ncbi:MAG: helix-turn-helix domain-containing protein, partial [Myxococcota bacterium]
VKVQLPPLRDRSSDIPLLVEHFMQLNGAACSIDTSSYAKLMAYDWPGNVRELKNVVDRAAALNRGKVNVDLAQYIQPDELQSKPAVANAEAAADLAMSFKEAKGRVISDFESRYIERLLRQHKNNISVAAREAGIDRKHFKDLMRKYGIAARPNEEEPAK